MIHIYKPNSKNAGCAASFGCGPAKRDDLALYISLIKQHSWNDSAKTGSFQENKDNPEKTANIKFNMFEVGDIIRAIRTEGEFKAYHTFGEDKTQITFKSWERGFGLSVKRNGIDFKLPLTFGEAETVRVFLEGMLLTNFRKSYAYKKENTTKQ